MPAGKKPHSSHRVLVIGAYGLIGSAVARCLQAHGFEVIGLGRDERSALSVMPNLEWRIHDLCKLRQPQTWSALLDGIDAVVNCAGALQDGAHDNLEIVHHHAIKSLAEACCRKNVDLIQISAVGADESAASAFMRTKGTGDRAIRESGARYWILRPGLVLAHSAYGGSLLLRMLAAFPFVQPISHSRAPIQTVSINDLAKAVVLAVKHRIPPGTECDLVERTEHSLSSVVKAHRKWLGFAPAMFEVPIPNWMVNASSAVADFLGLLGWRSPLRRAAIHALSNGVVGDSHAWSTISDMTMSSMSETLCSTPALAQDRLQARMALLMPLVVLVLFLFWLGSGIVGIWSFDDATGVLTQAGWSPGASTAAVMFWSLVDIAIALSLLWRNFASKACSAMIFVSIIYLVAATMVSPELWADPLGPLLKILPGIPLALTARVLLETR